MQALLHTTSPHNYRVFSFCIVDPPKVTHHPKCQSVQTGAEVIFTIEATGDDLTFQWQKNGSDVHNDSNYKGAETNTLSIRHVNKSDGGQYSCLVKNEVKRDGEVSEEAKLTVGESVLQLLPCTVVYRTAIECILNTKANFHFINPKKLFI